MIRIARISPPRMLLEFESQHQFVGCVLGVHLMKKRFGGDGPRVTNLVGVVGGAAESKRSQQQDLRLLTLKIQEQGGE